MGVHVPTYRETTKKIHVEKGWAHCGLVELTVKKAAIQNVYVFKWLLMPVIMILIGYIFSFFTCC